MRGILCWLAFVPRLSQADAHPPPRASIAVDDGAELSIIETTEQGEDPLGIDVATGSGLDEAARTLTPQPPQPLPTAQQGMTLSSLSQVREEAHAVHVEFAQGLAHVRALVTLVSAAKHRTEVSYRLALPRGAVVVSVAVCQGSDSGSKPCLRASPRRESGAADAYAAWRQAAPTEKAQTKVDAGAALYAEVLREPKNDALALRYASLAAGERATLDVRYVVEAKLQGGQVFLQLPARGEDPNLAQNAHFQVRTAGLTHAYPAEFAHDAMRPLTLNASLPLALPARESTVRARCGSELCSRRHVAAGALPYSSRPTWLWIDASPSMEGPARGRVDAVLAALLSALPGETPITAYAFAARAQRLGQFRADVAELSQLSDATLLDLDASTQPSHVVAETEALIAREKPRIFILTDGDIDPTPTERRALQRAAERGADLWILALGSRTPAALFPKQRTLFVSNAADRALAQGDLSELRAALNAPLGRELRTDGLRAGEQQVVETPARRAYTLHADSPWLAFWLARDTEPPPTWLALDGPQAGEPIIQAIPYVAAQQASEGAPQHTGMPAESVLEMLRTQLVPKARACLRADRRGRADYSVSLTFMAFFRAREISEMGIEGNLPEALRTCLSALLPRLRVPAFSGGVRIRYPIHTDRAPLPPVIELTPELRDTVQRVIETPISRK